MSQPRRVVALLSAESAPEHLARLQGSYRVLAILRPRILVVQIDDEELPALRQDPTLTGVYEHAVPPEVLARLRPEERLFVEGWVLQQSGKDKPRLGDGLSWDTPGFQPPDPPFKKQP